MPDLVKRLGSIRALSQGEKEETKSKVEDHPNDREERTTGRKEECRSIHIRLAQSQISKLDLLRLATKGSRRSLIEKAIEDYLSSDQVYNELIRIKKTIK